MNKWVRRFIYFIVGILALILLAFLFLQTRTAKNIIRNKLQAYISQKTNTEFLIGSLNYRLPSWVELNGVLMRDRNKDTLLFGSRIKANVAMIKLLSGKYQVDKIELDNMYVNLVKQETDSVFNFQFVVDAFKSKSEDSLKTKDTTLIDLSLKELILKKVRFNMLDNKTGSYTRLSVKDFELRLKNLDINALNFDIEKLYADELKFQLILQNKWADTTKIRTAAVWPTIKADSLIFKNSYIEYDDDENKIKSTNSIGQLQLLGFNNLQYRKLLTGKYIQLANSNIQFDHEVVEKKKIITVRDTIIKIEELGFIISDMDLSNNRITYNNNSTPVKINGFDYNHFATTDVRLKALNTSYQYQVFQSTIAAFAFKDKSGFQLDSLKGAVKLDSGNILLKDLYVKTPTSLLQANAMIYPLSLAHSGNGPTGLPQNNIILTNTIISKKDLDLLAESLTRKYKKQLNAVGDVLLNADIRGDAHLLYIRYLDARSVSGSPFRLQLSGTASNISDSRYLNYNFNIKNFTAPKSFFEGFTKNSSQPINWPQLITARGLLAGNMNRVKTNLQINSSFGNAIAVGTLSNFNNLASMQYDMSINAKNLETGKWVYQENEVGRITGNIKAKGSNGFNIKTANITTTASISSVRIQQRVLQNIKINAVLARGLAKFVASINDNILRGNIKGNANLKNKYPAINAFLNLQKADLKALGLSKDSMQLSTLADIDFKNTSPQNLDAYVRLDSTIIKTATQQIYSDSALIEAFVRSDSTIINMVSALADAAIASNLNYEQMPALLQEVMAYYYHSNAAVPRAPQGSIIAAITLKPSENYQALIKNISFKNAIVNALITNAGGDSAVKATVTAEQVQVGTNKLSNLAAVFSGTKDTLLMVINADTVQAGNIQLYEVNAKAGLANNNLSAALSASDENKKPQYAIAFDAAEDKANKGYLIHLKNGLLLNYGQWQVNEKNQTRMLGKAFNVKDFDISNNQQKISLNSNSTALNAPVLVNVSNFKLSTITAALDKDSLQLEGLLNAGFTVSDFWQTIPTIDGSLKLDSIIYQNVSVGNLALKANSSAGQVAVVGKLDGNGNNVDMNGRYNADNIDLKLNLNPLSLSSVQPFTMGNFVRSTGTISGPVTINGSVNDPRWNGELTLDSVQTTLAAFGTVIKADGQKILLQYPAIKLNDFIVLDSAGHALKINGNITQNSTKNFISDLSLSGKNFTAISSVATDNNQIYGKAIVEIEGQLTGDIMYPELSGNVTVKNGTELTYVQQAIPASLRDRDKLMEFIDMDTVTNLLAKNNMPDAPGRKKVTRSSGNLRYNLNLEVEPDAKLSIILDPATRDELRVQGSAQINAVVNPNGDLSLAGTYYLKDGSYQLNYGPVLKKFTLQSGSTITMSGDPLNAVVDITAIYDINATALDLVGNEIGGSTAAENLIYRRKVPFQVLLTIKGSISQPELSFDIVIKEKAEGVSYEMTTTIDNKLQQLRKDPSAMNKQVFALLAFNRFIGDQSTDFFGGGGLVNTNLFTNASVTGFLNAAVEQLAGNIIKGVDIDISLKNVDDDPAAKRTDLNVGLAKSFLDDRLNVSFGKNFTIAGDEPTGRGTNGSNNGMQFLPDINTTYKISKDGRYLFRAYRRNQYEAILDGYFIETGVAFSLTMDYDRFKELIKRKKK